MYFIDLINKKYLLGLQWYPLVVNVVVKVFFHHLIYEQREKGVDSAKRSLALYLIRLL